MKLEFIPRPGITHKVEMIDGKYRMCNPGSVIDVADREGHRLLANGEWREIKSVRAPKDKGPETALLDTETK